MAVAARRPAGIVETANRKLRRGWEGRRCRRSCKLDALVRSRRCIPARGRLQFTNRAASQCHSGLGSRGSGRERLEFFSRLEAHGFAGWNAYLLSGARVAADAGLARLHVEDAKAAKFDTFSAAERVFHGLENGLDGLFGFRTSDISLRYDGVYDVELDHTILPQGGSLC